MPEPETEPLFICPPTEAQWQHATDCLLWLAEVTGDPEVTRVMWLLDDEMRSLDA